jgi:hypothetical protein
MCGCSRDRLITIASGLQLKLGLGLILLGVGGLKLQPTAVLWPTLAAIVCGLLSVALSYTALVASKHNQSIVVVGYTGWTFALMFAALATECLVLVAEGGPSVQALCETFGGTACADATVDAIGAYYLHCELAARCALGMSIAMFSWAVVQQWLHDTEHVTRVTRGRAYHEGSGNLTSRMLIGLLTLFVTVGGAGTAGVAALMAPKEVPVTNWHATVIVSVVGSGCLGALSAIAGALTCQYTTRPWFDGMRSAEALPGASKWICRRACSLGTDIPLLLAVAWICLSTVLFSLSFGEDAKSNFDRHWAAYATAWPELVGSYCTKAVDILRTEQSDTSWLDGGEYDQECVLAAFRDAQSQYRLAAGAIAVAFCVQILIVQMLLQAVRAARFPGDVILSIPVIGGRQPRQLVSRASDADRHLDEGPV